MAKDKSKKKNKSKTSEVELTKKERKALEAREVELAAKLESKGKKAKGDKEKKADPPKADPPKATDSNEERIAFLESIVADSMNNSQNTQDKARKELVKLKATLPVEPETIDDSALKAKVKGKRQARENKLDPDSVDRSDEAAVKAYNEAAASAGTPIHLITSDAELEREADRLKGETTPPENAPSHVTEEVETEAGREFKAGPAGGEDATDAFGTIEDNTPKVERDTFGRPKIFNPLTGKAKAYTRVTTYIDNLEDKSQLEKWKLRTLLEGVAINSTDIGESANDSAHNDSWYVGQARDAMHIRDVAIAKLNKADRKGKLEPGERGPIEEAILKTFKTTLDNIAREALEVGGVHEKAQKGTDLHALCELYDMQGMGAINDKLKRNEITPADHADIVAYASAMLEAGIKVLECEQMVVLDDLGVAGTLDRLVLAKLPGTQRAVRMVGDIKTGRVDYGVGKIAQQIRLYSQGKGYDPADPKARRDLKASTAKGLLVHLPAGTATCTIHVVDLTLGSKGNKLSGEVRAWRNEGKKAIDFKVNLAATTETATEEPRP